MRASAPTAAAFAFAAALALTACDSGGGDSGTEDRETGRSGAACRLDGVAVDAVASAAPAAGDTGTVSFTVTNRGAACTLDGLPAVTLVAGDTSVKVPADAAAPERKLTLAEATAVSFTLTYVRGEADGGHGLAVTTARVALPGAADTRDFPWSYGDVSPKDGGTEVPDATVGPFQQAGD
ncbi:hypothetical protein TU94_15030 [Streptomyces cyaneogriseus subsp. noncyanogenus]|uniref:DUF4232 domain-containing protein n=1 Tax=Streptomyces cyaneogriseus subsp. noncyanogenus TaxID=477245 RepID=A0A0C5G234_9ACTN|nr:DUF4232 domain-containing protein [Streptomyces cyaneogriseus]AJP02605.1 hypothetical protein TU94_15030 [Streptomyces cyaneogriseus subsp. noncyanogenus]